MTPPGLIHVTAAVVALVAGAILLAGRKGTMRHRRLGYLYLGAMAYVNLAAWSVDTRGAAARSPSPGWSSTSPAHAS